MIIAPLRRNVNYPSGISAPTEMPFDILRGAGGVQLHSPEHLRRVYIYYHYEEVCTFDSELGL